MSAGYRVHSSAAEEPEKSWLPPDPVGAGAARPTRSNREYIINYTVINYARARLLHACAYCKICMCKCSCSFMAVTLVKKDSLLTLSTELLIGLWNEETKSFIILFAITITKSVLCTLAITYSFISHDLHLNLKL